MNLAIDIGNTRIKAGWFRGDALEGTAAWGYWSLEDLVGLATNQNIKNVILSNVGREVPKLVMDFLAAHFSLIELTDQTRLPIRNLYRTPKTLGKDRLAAVVGAWHLFPGSNCLVIDAGTCITYDILRKDGVYLGGNISPGIDLRFKAMHHFTAGLPLVERNETENWIGYSTESAIQNGVQSGILLEMEGFISLCRKEIGQINVILTGGDADFFVKKLKSLIFVNPNLVLIGLNKILSYNVQQLA